MCVQSIIQDERLQEEEQENIMIGGGAAGSEFDDLLDPISISALSEVIASKISAVTRLKISMALGRFTLKR